MPEDYLIKIKKIAEFKYELSEEVLNNYLNVIEVCWENNFSPIRTVDYIAEKIF